MISIEGTREDVDSLLVGKTANEPDQWDRRLLWKTKLGLQRRLAHRFPREVLRRVVRREVDIRFRVPYLLVDAIEDADHVGAAFTHHAVETISAFGCLDFPRVAGRNRRYEGCMVDAALQQVDAVVRLETLVGEEIPPELGMKELGFVEPPLVAHVVHREHRRRAANPPSSLERVQIDRNERSLPIVGVDHVGKEF